MRTTRWQVVKLAWALCRHPARDRLRIGQILVDPFYVENDRLIERVSAARLRLKALRRQKNGGK